MSKEKNPSPLLGFQEGIVIDQSYINGIAGRVLTIIETIGLRKKQEDALKSLLRNAVFADERLSIVIDSELYSKIYEAKRKIKVEANLDVRNMRYITLEDLR